MNLALYQPDIAQNTGTMIRLAACLNVPIDIIEPCGFPFSARGLKRAGMDYVETAEIKRHTNWEEFNTWRLEQGKRLILLTTKAAIPYTECTFRPDDIIMVGRESAGVEDFVHEAADERVIIPMPGGLRSINVAISAGMVLGEALRQTDLFTNPE